MKKNELKTLIVEDDLRAAETLCEFLDLRGKMKSVIACDVEDALSLFNSDFEFAIIDINLSGEIDGLELLRRLKALNPNLFIVIVTASDIDDNRKISLSLGADAFLPKPLDFGSLDVILDGVCSKKTVADHGKT
jgi:two-component system response regulator FlrC